MSQMTARDKILSRLQAADCKPLPIPDTAAFYAQRLHEDLATRVERLALNLSNAMAEVHRTTTAELPAALARVIRDKSLPTVAVGPEVLARQSLCDQLQNVCALLPVTTAHTETPALFNQVDAGLTLSHAAIAETGTVVLWCDAQSPRLLSLVPPVHIVVVDTRRTFDTLFALMHQEDWCNGLPTNVVLVSSPSKTADIQQTLAYGAHGPKQLIVMLVEDR
jgi:L-lactate dehydrogenase complex protein LldG